MPDYSTWSLCLHKGEVVRVKISKKPRKSFNSLTEMKTEIFHFGNTLRHYNVVWNYFLGNFDQIGTNDPRLEHLTVGAYFSRNVDLVKVSVYRITQVYIDSNACDGIFVHVVEFIDEGKASGNEVTILIEDFLKEFTFIRKC
jgi:hypothetical protein